MTGLTPEARALLRFAPLGRRLLREVRDQLPAGSHVAILVTPNDKPASPVVAASTDRRVMGLAAARWSMDVLRDTDTHANIKEEDRGE